MSKCNVKTQEIISNIKGLANHDVKFKDFKEVASLILNSTMSENVKATSLNAYLKAFQELSDEGFVVSNIENINPSLSGIDFINNLAKAQDINYQVLSQEQLSQRINELSSKSNITIKDIKGIINDVKNIYNSLTPNETTDAYIRDIYDKLFNTISHSVDNLILKESYLKEIKAIEELQGKSLYVDIDANSDHVKLADTMFIVREGENLRAVEGFITEDGPYELLENENVVPIQGTILMKNSRKNNEFYSNESKHKWTNNLLEGNLHIKQEYFTTEEGQSISIYDILSNPNNVGKIKFHAVKLGDLGESRLKSIHSLKTKGDEYRAIENRQHETFETDAQKEYLLNNRDSKVISVARPKSEEQNFAFLGEIDGVFFTIYGLENYVFVSSDNTTESINFNSPKHLDMVEALSTTTDNASLSSKDKMALQHSFNLFQELKTEVEPLLRDARKGFLGDVTHIFKKYFVPQTTVAERIYEPLRRSLNESDSQLLFPVEMVEIDSEGNVIKQKTRNIPMLIQKTVSDGEVQYTPLTDYFLKSNERFVVKVQDRIEYLNYSDYINSVYGKFLEDRFAKENTNITEYQDGKRKVLPIQTHFFALKNVAGGTRIQILDRANGSMDLQKFLSLFKNLQIVGNAFNRDISKLIRENFRITAKNNKRKSLDLAPEFFDKGKKLFIKYKIWSSTDRYGTSAFKDIITKENEQDFMIEVPKDLMNSYEKKFIDVLNSITGRNVSENGFKNQFKDIDSIIESVISEYNEGSSNETLVNGINQLLKLKEQYNNDLYSLVENHFKDSKFDEFKRVFKQEYQRENLSEGQTKARKELSPTDLLFYDFNGTKSLNIINTNNNDYVTVKSIGRNFSIAPNVQPVAPNKNIENLNSKEIIETTAQKPMQAPVVERQDIIIEDDASIDSPFYISQGEKTIEYAEVQKELDWLSNALPQVETRTEGIEELAKNLEKDRVALGAFINDAIYLNSQMMKDDKMEAGVVYHEAFHFVFRRILTPTERQDVLNTILNNLSYAKRFTREAKEQFAKERGLNYNDKKITELIAEELLADKFRAFKLKRKKINVGNKTVNDFLTKVFDALIKIMDWITGNQSNLDLFYKIDNGEFKNIKAKENYYKDEVAFASIPGPIQYTLDTQTKEGKPKYKASRFDLGNKSKELVHVVTRELQKVKNLEAIGFDKAFDMITTELIKNRYNLDVITKNHPKAEAIRERFGALYSAFNFALGARLKGFENNDIGVPEGVNPHKKSIVHDASGNKVDNTEGKYSHGQLKDEVKRRFNQLMRFEELKNEVFNSELVDKAEDNHVTDKNAETSEMPKERFETTMGEVSPLEFNKMMRELFSNLEKEVYYSDLDITLTENVDGDRIFPLLIKLTAGQKAENIIEHLRTVSKTYERNGDLNTASDIMAVYNLVQSKANNSQTRNLVIDALHNEQMSYDFFNVTKREGYRDGEVSDTYTVRIFDQVSETFARQKRDNILLSMITVFEKNKNNSEFKAKVKTLSKTLNRISQKVIPIKTNSKGELVLPKQFLLTGIVNNKQELLDEYVNTLHSQLKDIGLNLPPSLIEISLMHIAQSQHNVKPEAFNGLSQESIERYEYDSYLIEEGVVLTSTFFTELSGIVNSMYVKGNPNPTYINNLDDSISKNSAFLTILKDASNYIIKYDPKDTPNVIKNAEEKNINAISKPGAFSERMRQIRTTPLENLFDGSVDPDGVLNYLRDIPYFEDIINNKDSKTSKEMRLFLKNFKHSVFGGLKPMSINSKNELSFQEGSTYKHTDRKTLYLLALYAFMNRNTITDGEATVETFSRIHHQEESLGTAFLIPAVKRRLVNNKGELVKSATGTSLVVNNLMHVIKREFNRMSRERDRAKQLLNDYNGKIDNKLLLKYNFIVKDGQIVPGGRAYRFMEMADFFEQNRDIEERLMKAFHEKSEFDISDEIILGRLKEYATASYNRFRSEFKNIEKLIPSSLKLNYSKIPVKELYDSHEALIRDFYFNDWINRIMFNPLIDGDIAMNNNNFGDVVKRNKRWGAAGANLKTGFTRTAFAHELKAYLHPSRLELGYFMSEAEIVDRIDNPELQQEVLEGFRKGDMIEVFDGQSISTIYHHISMLDKSGLINREIKDILIAKNYRRLTPQEQELLRKSNISLNPKKTVTADTFDYHKLSESYTDRTDVSILRREHRVTNETKMEAYKRIDALWREVYDLQDIITENPDEYNTYKEKIRSLVSEIHGYFEAKPHKTMLHKILNSMEYDSIDQLIDGTASKVSTLMPLDLMTAEGEYFDLRFHSSSVDNKFKFNQVSTAVMHDYTKGAVQKKLLLIADIVNHINLKGDSNSVSAKALLNAVETFESTLRDGMKSRFNNFKEILREGGNINVSKLYEVIRQDLEAQGESDFRLKMFDLFDGQPEFNQNMPEIAKTISYYLFSLYSRNITDEKTAGGNYILKSEFGDNLLIDENGNIVRESEYEANPGKYVNTTSRPLQIVSEVKNGITYYYAEAKVSKPSWIKTKADEKLFFDKMNLMMGVRIPTEDKRSMIALKIVDFIDETHGNVMVTPTHMMLLSGWDFDVDKLFVQSKASYTDLLGTQHIYGDYSDYKNENIGKFVEYFQFITEQKELKQHIRNTEELLSENQIELINETELFLTQMGFTSFQINNLKEELENNTVSKIKESISDNLNTYRELKSVLKDEDLRKENNQQIRYERDLRTIVNTFLKYEASRIVLNKYKLPFTLTDFNRQNKIIVSPTYQNQNLDAQIDVLANEYTYNNLYINERSSVENFKTLVKDLFNLDMTNFLPKSNGFALDYVVNMKSISDMNKDGIELAASINKFIAFASQNQIELKANNVIWNHKTKVGEEVKKLYLNKYGFIDKNGERAIEIVGNILGMYADGMKVPLPPVLGMNEINTSVTLAMLGIGVEKGFAIAMNHSKYVRNAIQKVQESKNSIGDDFGNSFTTFEKELSVELEGLLQHMPELMRENILDNTGALKTGDLTINYNPTPIDIHALQANTLSFESIGFEVILPNNTKLSPGATEALMLSMYIEQAKQTSKLRKSSSLTNFYKALNPDEVIFNRMYENMQEFKDTESSLFTKASLEKTFSDDKVWTYITEIADDLTQQLDLMLLHRKPLLRPLMNSFSKYFNNPATISEIFTNFVGLRGLLNMQDKRDSSNPFIAQDINMIKEIFSPEFWFSNTLREELNLMKEAYPNNSFLAMIEIAEDKTNHRIVDGKKQYLKYPKLIGKAKLKGNMITEFHDGMSSLNDLNFDSKMFLRKISFAEIIRTGMQVKKTGSFYNHIMPSLKKDISDQITSFLKETSSKNMMEGLKDFLGVQDERKVIDLFDNLFLQLASNLSIEENAKYPKIKRLPVTPSEKQKPSNRNFALAFKTNEGRVQFVREVFGIKESVEIPIDSKRGIKLTSLLEGDMTLDFSNVTNQEALFHFSEGLNIETVTDKERGILFNFPPVIQIGNPNDIIKKGKESIPDVTMYILKSVDSSDGTTTPGESFLNSTLGSGEFITSGMKARYTPVSKTMASKYFSSLAFDKNSIEEFNRLKDGVVLETSKQEQQTTETKSEMLSEKQLDLRTNYIQPKITAKEVQETKQPVKDENSNVRMIREYYNGLSKEQQNDLGNVESLIEEYNTIPFNYPVEKFIKDLEC